MSLQALATVGKVHLATAKCPNGLATAHADVKVKHLAQPSAHGLRRRDDPHQASRLDRMNLIRREGRPAA